MIRRVEHEVECGGMIEFEIQYYLGSVKMSAEMFGQTVRGHQGIGNRLN
jgi:hypothetical protein